MTTTEATAIRREMRKLSNEVARLRAIVEKKTLASPHAGQPISNHSLLHEELEAWDAASVTDFNTWAQKQQA